MLHCLEGNNRSKTEILTMSENKFMLPIELREKIYEDFVQQQTLDYRKKTCKPIPLCKIMDRKTMEWI